MNVMAIAGAVALGGGIVYWGYLSEKKRREAFQKVALELGFQFQGDGGGTLQVKMTGLPLFERGRGARITNCLTGAMHGFEVTIFDYSYVVGSGKNKHTRRQSVVLVSGKRVLPKFELRPENVFDKIAGMVGYEDLDFPMYPEFSKKYLLKSPDENGTRTLFSPPLINQLEKDLGWSLAGSGTNLLVYRERKVVEPPKARELVEKAIEFAQQFALGS